MRKIKEYLLKLYRLHTHDHCHSIVEWDDVTLEKYLKCDYVGCRHRKQVEPTIEEHLEHRKIRLENLKDLLRQMKQLSKEMDSYAGIDHLNNNEKT